MNVIVLGAGVVGVTAAWYLAEAGHEVTVLERRAEPGLETSFANGGQISASHAQPWAKPEVLPRIVQWLGREDAPMLFRPRAEWAQWAWGLRFLRECLPGRFERHARALAAFAIYSRDSLRELRRRTGIRYDELARGILHFATREADFDALARHAEALRPLGIEQEVKTAAECLQIEPALAYSEDRVVGGVYAPQDESGDAYRFTRELARLAQEKGVRFRHGVEIEALEEAGDVVYGARATDGERHVGDAYVVCLGCYSPRLLRPLGIRIPVYPLKGYSVTLPLGPAEAPAAPSVSLTDEAHKLVVSRLGERLRVAGTAELAGYDPSVNDVRCAAILRRVRQLFPQLGALNVVESWAGLRPATPSNVPVIGRTRLRNLYLDTGHGTLGWTLACGSGRAIADIVSGRTPEVRFDFLA